MFEPDIETLVDSHVHAYAPDAGAPSFDPLARFTLGGDDPGFLESDRRSVGSADLERLQRNTRSTMAYNQAVHELADWLGCEPTAEAVRDARADAAKDYRGFVRRLLHDVRCEAMLVDLGHPADVDLAAIEDLTGVDIRGVFRIEPLIARMWDEHEDFASFEGDYLANLERASADTRVVAFKTVIAYRTGLAVQHRTKNEVAKAFGRLKASPAAEGLLRQIKVPADVAGDVKTVRDHLGWLAFELALAKSLPFQVHTGWGDQDLDMNLARPGLLADVLRDPRLRHLPIVLLHGAYPFYEEAAYLCNIFPNVYVDLSLLNPFLGPGVNRVLQAIFDLAPFTKVMYSSDASGCPDLQWVAARRGRQSVAAVLSDAVGAGILSAKVAHQAARAIFADNARPVYRLSDRKAG